MHTKCFIQSMMYVQMSQEYLSFFSSPLWVQMIDKFISFAESSFNQLIILMVTCIPNPIPPYMWGT